MTDPTQEFQVRLLKVEEIDAAVDLLGRQLREHRVKTNLDNVRSIIERIVKDDRLGFLLVALEKNERPIGVALGCAFLGIEHGGTSGWIEELYVLPEFRQRGVGSLLIAECIRVASGSGWRAIDLEVDSHHRRALTLYERHGFTPLGRARLSLRLGEPG
jgi:ribosomal protein S18 acetylase RimI-like enzyme